MKKKKTTSKTFGRQPERKPRMRNTAKIRPINTASVVREDGKERLQKILATAGVGSRRACEEMILEGIVTVNGQVVAELPAFADALGDDIRVNGRRIKQAEKVYYLLNKPKNVLCTSADPYGRKIAVDLIPTKERIFCVGRLDADTTGAIILTNDSELTNRLTHPRYELPKVYSVRVRGKMEGEDIDKLKKGVWLAEGKTQKAMVKVLHRTPQETTLELTIKQGLNRQIRRTMASIGFKVLGLRRVKIGDIDTKGIPLGGYKKLTKSQIGYLKKATGLIE